MDSDISSYEKIVFASGLCNVLRIILNENPLISEKKAKAKVLKLNSYLNHQFVQDIFPVIFSMQVENRLC